MQRRTVLRGLAALAAGAGAGCTANREVPAVAPEPPAGIATPEEDEFAGESGGDGDGSGDDAEPTPDQQRFVIPARTFRSDEDGDLLVELMVRNRADVAHEAVLTVSVGADDKTFTSSRHVVLQRNASRQYVFRFPIAERQMTDFDPTFESGPPDTPIPEGTVTPYLEDRPTATDRETRASTSADSDSNTTGATAAASSPDPTPSVPPTDTPSETPGSTPNPSE
ncbi:hypothetical protein [Halosimplex carlsbadense]|uniref:hypothetical protein n=1 Tax=Halosimplex carlsbadense TaxID=171164 RepID=UPI00067805CB|nr:hypothetical protein [Halosimplex carlsbadense]